MSEKLVAGLVTAAVLAPVCAACILGPVVLASVLAGMTGWLGGVDFAVTAGALLVAGIAVYGIVRRGRGSVPRRPREER